ITLLGPGGIGKTRLSLQIGAEALGRFGDGVWFVELAALTTSAQIDEALARLFAVRLESNRPVIDQVAASLRTRTLLLIIDNCEHLIDGAAATVAALLAQCPGIGIIASSRAPLGLIGEQRYEVPALDVPTADQLGTLSAAAAFESTAVRLFVDRARLVQPEFILDDANAPIVATICHRLDGLALAIELAAARLRLLSPAALLDRLDDRFRLLTGGSRTGLAHQQTLRALIDWSHDLLGEAERIAFRRLAVFAGSITVAAAEAVIGMPPLDPNDGLDLISALLDQSLIARLPLSGHDARVRLLDSTRAYALERLAAAGEVDAAYQGLTRYLIGVFSEAEARWPTCETDAWRATYQPDIDNLRAALAWAFGPQGDARLGVALLARTMEANREGLTGREYEHWMAQAAAAITPDTPLDQVARIRLYASGGYTLGDARDVEGCRTAFMMFRSIDDTVRACRAAMALAWAIARPGDVMPAQPYIDFVTASMPRLPQDKHRGIVLLRLATLASYAGDQTRPRQLWQEAISIAERFNDPVTIRLSAINLADFEASLGHYDQAIAATTDVVQTCRESGDHALLASALTNLVTYALLVGQIETARAAGREAISLLLDQSDDVFLAICCESMACLAALCGQSERAVTIATCTDAFFTARGMVRDVAEQAVWHALTERLGHGIATRPDPPASLRDIAALACLV
ncbi:ATP-binding protein, partial [Acidiphilium sp.]|uniref:ATP-binding protein n=1 Tax=Acidiphilium sp. TaxID=527 RepID=UPI003D01D64B